MRFDEGYIKYESVWEPGPPPPVAVAEELDRWRQELFALEQMLRVLLNSFYGPRARVPPGNE